MTRSKQRLFFTGSVRLIGDGRLSGLDCRVYACVSLHDGMSLMKGRGAGCFASNLTLAGHLGCDYTSLSKALRRLEDWGYLIKEKLPADKRMTVYRVTFPEPDSWRNDQSSGAEIVGGSAKQAGEIVGLPKPLTSENQEEKPRHYIPLRVVLDSAEAGKIDSAEAARQMACRAVQDYDGINAYLAFVERVFRNDRNSLSDTDWRANLDSLTQIYLGSECGSPEYGRAERLGDEIDAWLNEGDGDRRRMATAGAGR